MTNQPHNPAAVLLARLWSIGDYDGEWGGADTVDVVCEWLEEQGFHLIHPAESIAEDDEKAGRGAWTFDELLTVAESQVTR